MISIGTRYCAFVTAAAACALLLAAPSGAQTTDQTAPPSAQTAPMQPGVMPNAGAAAQPGTTAHHAARHVETVDDRIKSLHDRLKITPAQEESWGSLAQIIRDNAQAMDKLVQERQQNLKTMNASEDLKSYEEITEAHADALKKLAPAFDALYATMSDVQKKNADKVFRTVVQRHIPKATAPKA